MKTLSNLADRILEKVAPHAIARATDCGYYCCGAQFYGAYCCFYPNGSSHCGDCTRRYC